MTITQPTFLSSLLIILKGGEGSGNLDHEGIPGHQGGSASADGGTSGTPGTPGTPVTSGTPETSRTPEATPAPIKKPTRSERRDSFKSASGISTENIQDYDSDKLLEESEKLSSAQIKQDMKQLGIRSNEIQKLPLGVQQEIWASTMDNVARYPHSVKINKIGVGDLEERVLAQYSYARKELTVSREFFSDHFASSDSLMHQSQTGWHPKSCDTLKSVVDHEFGHSFSRAAYSQSGRYSSCKKLFDGFQAKDIISGLSTYATHNVNEFIAEGWAEYRNSGNPRPMAQQIGKTMELTLR